MQPRPKVWIPTILGIFIVAFLVGFAPIRWEHESGFNVDSTFAFTVKEPLYEAPGEIDSVRKEIVQTVQDAGIENPEVLIRDKTLFSVDTAAVTREQAAEDEQAVTDALKARYETLQATRLPSGETVATSRVMRRHCWSGG